MKRLLVIFFVATVMLWATDSFAATWTNFGGYQPPTCCADESWDGVYPPPKAINPPGFLKKVGKWNVMVKSGLSVAAAQIWWAEDGTVVYKLHFRSAFAARYWLEHREPKLWKIERAIKNWPWEEPTNGLWQKWIPLNKI